MKKIRKSIFYFLTQKNNGKHLFFFFRYGRRNPLVAAVFIQLITGVATAFAPWFWLFCILRFLTAAATGGTMVTR